MKKHLLFNQSFGTEGSPNQTGETQTRENRIGLMSYLHRTLMLLFAVLVMSIANIGMAWGESQTFAASEIISTDNKDVTTTKGNITIKGVACGSKTQDRQMCKTGNTTTNKSAFQLSSSAGNDPTTKYIEISVPSGYKITSVTLEAVNGGSSSEGKISAFMWNGTYALAFDGKTEITIPGYAGTCGVTTSVSGISGNAYRTVRIYKQVKYTGSSLVTSGGTAYPSSANSANIHQIIVECEAATTKKIYLKNTMGWVNAYVTRLGTSAYWSSDLGSGSYGRYGTHAMTYDSAKKLFYYEAPADANDTYLCFTADNQSDYANFNGTQAVYVNGGYVYGKVVWVQTDNTFYKNNTKYYGNEDHSGIAHETYSADVFLSGTFNAWAKTNDSKFSESAGTFTKTIELAANTAYQFQIIDNAWFGNNGGVVQSQTNWDFYASSGNCHMISGPAGNYTFTYSRTTNKVSISYPEVVHPNAGYVYYDNSKTDWSTCQAHHFTGGSSMVSWNSCPAATAIDICGTEYFYSAFDKDSYSTIIFHNGSGTQTGDWSLNGNGGKKREKDDADWSAFATYTISFNGNGKTSGTMSSISSITANHSQTITSNTFEKSGYTFAGWKADVAVKINGSTVSAGTVIDDGATLQNICGNIALTAQWSCITPDAPAAAKITATDGCAGSAGATFSADDSGKPSYVTWYWQTASDGTSTSSPVSSDYETASTAGSKTMYVRAKNTACDSWSTATSKSATVKTAATIAWNTAPADGTAGGSMTASVTSNYSAGVAYAVTSASPAGCVTINSTNGAISYVAAGTATITATVTGAGDYCGSANVSKSITVTAPATPIITYNIRVSGDGSNIAGAAATTTDGTNISTISIDETNSGKSGSPTGSNRSMKIKIKTGANGADWSGDPTNYVLFKFKVACGKKLTPSKIHIPVANVGSKSKDNIKYKAVMSDKYGHSLSGTYVVASQDGTVEDFDINNADASKYFQGEVTLKLWAWTIADKSDGGSDFRLGTPVTIFGEVGTQATPAATITWNTQPANGQVGDPDFAYDVTCSDGSSVTVTSANTTYATIVGGKLHYASAGTTHLVASATDACGNVLTPVNSNDFTVSAAAPTHDVTFSLTNVVYSSGDNQGTDAATEGVEFSTVFAASSGYSLPGTITVEIGDVEQTEGTGYTWSKATGTLTIPAAYVTGDIEVTIVGEELEGDGCEELVNTRAASASTLTTSVGSATLNSPSSQSYSGAIKLNSSGYIEVSPKAGSSFAVGDSLIVVIYNGGNGTKTTGFKIGDNSYTTDIAKAVTHTFRQKLVAANIVSSKVKFERASSEGYYVSIIIKHCEDLDACTTPTLPTLSNQTVCPGSDIAAWDATVSNASTISAAGESVAYSWKKKGNDTELAATASFDLGSSATEGMAGTYVVTVTVSKTGYISKSANAEVTLTVTPTTEEPSVTQSPAKVYTSGSVTLTATCGSEGAKTWQWYTCTNAAGDGESILSGKNSAEYAFTAPASAGTYYYKVKVTGDGTNACGTASHVYALSVNAATGGDCTTYYWFANADDATTNSVTQNESSFFSGAKSGTNNNSTTITVDETELTITKRIGASAETVTFTVPSEKTATLYVNAKANSSSKPLILVRTATSDTIVVTTSTTLANYSAENITTGAWKLTCGSGNNWYYGAIIVKVCSAGSCTDAEPVATATNTTVCSGTALTITATGYETSPTTIQWQKKNGSSWDNISGATTATYTVASAAAEHAGTYRVQVTKGCVRNSNEVTIAVPSAPVFGDVPSSVTVMQTIALSISTVEASDAASYKWYKSANNTWDAGDAEIGSSKELMKAYADEAIGSPSYYVFCRATNSCATTTSSAIAVNVTAYVDADCAIAGSSGEHNTFSKTGSVSSGTYGSVTELHTNSNNKYLQYVAEDGYYFKTAKVNACVSDASSLPTAAYSYSTDGGANWTDAALPTAMTTAYADHVIDPLPANVNAFRVGRKLGDYGSGSGTLYIHEVCFEYSESCTSTTVTASPTSKTHTIGDSFTKPTFTVKHGETAFDPQPSLTYTSSNEDIATVDDDGTVNFQGMTGTVTITASFAGGTISATEYCASTGSYTITVSCSSERPKIVPGGTVNMSGCNPSVALNAKMQDGTSDFSPAGTYQWYRDGEAISGATSASYTALQAGIYTVERTYDGCTNVSSNNATITSERVEPEVEHLVPFQYYHVDSIYHETSIMRYRHLFTVKASEEYNSTGRNFKMELSKNGSTPEDKTTSNAFVVKKSADNTVDTVLIDLNKLSGKFAEGDELIFTCKAVDCAHNVSEVYKDSITMHVIDKTPTMALILAGKDGGTLDEYEPKNLQEQTGSKSWSGEWPLYTEMKKQYIITPLNGYAPFNKLNYEQYDIIFLTDFPKKSKNATAINNLADLCDYRPLFTFKTHMSGLSKWATKGFTEDPEVPKQSRLRLNIVCYAHPMFEELQTPSVKNQMLRDAGDNTQLVYTLLKEGGYEKNGDVKKGIQGFDFSASDNFVTIGLIHYDATAADSVPDNEHVTWTPGSADQTLVAAAERQYNPEARMVMFSLNAGAHSKLTETGQNVVLACLEYLLQDVMITPMADCAYTFDNDEGRGDGKWSVATNWLQEEVPGPYQSVRIIAPVTVDCTDAKALEVRLVDNGKITIAKNGVLTVQSTIRRKDGSETLPTEEDDIVIETAADGQGALIFNNDRGDSRATVNLYSKGRKDGNNYQFQYIAMPMGRVPVHPYFEGSDIFTYAYTEAGGWERRGYYTDLYAFEGIGVTTRRATASNYTIKGALTSTEAQTLDMTYENPEAVDKGYNMFGNSWSAPIQISQLRVGNEDANIQKTVYIYVAGKDPDGGPTTSGDKTEVEGKWLAIPFDASGFGEWTGLKVIPAFQAFEIQTNAAATLSLDYDKMVRSGTTDRNAALRGPQRRSADHEGIELMVLHLNGGKVSNDLFLFEGEQFSEEFDNGWEATYKEDEEIPTQLYSPTVAGKMAVAALPTLEGTQVNFKTDEAGEYTFTFSGAEIGYYLNDIKEQESALIKEGNAYVFTLEDGDDANRFYISRTPLGAPAIVTGIDEVDAEAMKVRKIIHNDQLYIIRGGQLYDATGKVVK